MSTTDTRAAFEAALRNKGATERELRHASAPYEGLYANPRVQMRWEGWQAATEAAKATGTAGEPVAWQFEENTHPDRRAGGGVWERRVEHTFHPDRFIADSVRNVRPLVYAEAARQPAPVAEIEPCGGCGNADPDKRCIGCAHPFRQVTPECTLSEDEIYDIERCIRTGVTMGYTEKKGAEKALAIFKAATNRSQP